MSWGQPWPGSGGESLRSARLPPQVGPGGRPLSQCCGLCCHFLFRLPEEAGSPSLSAAPPEFGTTRSPMGQFLSSTFFEDSLGAVWHERLYEGEGKGVGEAALVLQDQVMYREKGNLDLQQGARGHSVSRQGWSWKDPGGPPLRAPWQPTKGTSALGLFD